MIDDRTTAYLLNELSEHEAEQFEEQCFAQAEWPDAELSAAEEDLILAYVKDELSPERKRLFEENYLKTEARIERVLLARSFLEVVCTADQPKLTLSERLSGFWKSLVFAPRFAVLRFAAIVLVFGLITTLSWFAFRTRAPQTFAQLSLTISTDTRAVSGQARKVKLPLEEDALKISLALPESRTPGATYRVQWEDVKGPRESLNVEKQDTDSISVVIPAGKLARGQYVLKLFRKDPAGTEERVPGNYLFIAE